MRAIDAKAYAGRKFPVRERGALDQNARKLGALAEHVIGPFQLDRGGRRADVQGFDQRNSGDKTKLRRKARGRRIDQQQRGVEITARRGPGATKPTTPSGLLPRYNPQTTCFASANTGQSLVAGGAQNLIGSDAIAASRGFRP